MYLVNSCSNTEGAFLCDFWGLRLLMFLCIVHLNTGTDEPDGHPFAGKCQHYIFNLSRLFKFPRTLGRCLMTSGRKKSTLSAF